MRTFSTSVALRFRKSAADCACCLRRRRHADARCAESARIKERFPGRVPVIVERAPKADVPLIDKAK